MGDSNGIQPGIHAEHDAIRKLLPLKRKSRLENINILVIRLSSKNKIQSSKPCINCINMMKTLPPKLGYRIQHIYYSNEEGNIIKTTLQNLENEQSLEIDKIKFQKMIFLFNALDNGWSIKKRKDSYIFTKNHEGKKEIFDESYLAIFMKDNSDINKLLT